VLEDTHSPVVISLWSYALDNGLVWCTLYSLEIASVSNLATITVHVLLFKKNLIFTQLGKVALKVRNSCICAKW